MVPRQQLLSVPFAVQAQQAQVATSLASGAATTLVPPGSVMAYMGTNAPPGWLLCDGSVVSTNQYFGLFSIIGTSSGSGTNGLTFRLPDLRGTFLRGADSLSDFIITASAIDTNLDTITITNHGINRTGYPLSVTNLTGSLPGGLSATNSDGTLRAYYAIVIDAQTIQLAASETNAFASIPINITSKGGTNKVTSWLDLEKAVRTAAAIGANVGNSIGSVQTDQLGSHTHTYLGGGNQVNPGNGPAAGCGYPSGAFPVSSSGGDETRPKNVYVNYIIKY
jgi:microcystin-dependent protein